MAEQLGQAVLELTVDTKALEKGLDNARKKIAALTGDVNLGIKAQGADAPQQALKNISTQAERAATRVQTLNQVLNQIPGNSYAKLSASISKLTSESRDLQLTSEQYLKTLTRIRELEGIRQLKVGRQQALAGEAAYSPSGALGQLDQSQLPQLPLTLEGQAQNIRELQQRLRNLNYESAEYAETLRVLQNAQRQYDQALSGTSDTYRQLAQQEEAAIRRAEKLRGIQEYYADKNPRAGGIRDDNGSMLARGANSAADERAYNASLRPSKELLENDLQRVQALRQVTQRLQEQLALIDQIRGKQGDGGFGAASASNFGTTDPVQKSIRRNQEKVARQDSATQGVRDQFDADLARVRETRIKAEKAAADAASRTAVAERAAAKEALDAATARRNRRNETLSNALIGGAFPLLFGQGLGASIGGGVGGAAGGQLGGQFGFGLSLIGTAVGQQFDVAIQKVQLLGEALDDPIAKFSELADAGLVSSKSQEKLIQNLIAVGREAEAQALLQQDLAASFGDLESARELADATDELYRAFAQLSTLLAQLAGPILTGVINSVSGLIRKYAQLILLSPDRVQARERQATDIVASQIAPGQGSGFFGAVNVKFNGKTYTGSATGIREQIVRDLLQQEFEQTTSDTKAGGINSKELEKLVDLRKQLKQLTFDQIAADGEGRKAESLRLEALKVELELAKELRKYNDKNDPGGALREDARSKAEEKKAKIRAQQKNLGEQGSLTNIKEELNFTKKLADLAQVGTQEFADLDRAVVIVTNSVRDLEYLAAQVRFDNWQSLLDTKQVSRSLINLQDQLQAAQQIVDRFDWNRLDADPKAADEVISQLVRVQDEIDKVENAKATVTVRVIGAEIAAGEIANSFSNVNRQLQAAQKAVETFNWDELYLDPSAADQAVSDLTRVQDSVRELEKRKAEVTVRVIGAQIANGEIARSFNNLRDQLNAAQTVVDNFDFNSLSVGAELAQKAQNEIRALQGLPPLPFKVGREGLTAAIADLVRIQDQINKIDGTKATVEVEVLQAGISTGAITNSIANNRALQSAAQRAFDLSAIDSPEALKAAGAYFRAGEKLEEAGKLLAQTPKALQETVDNLRKSLQDAVLAQQQLVGTNQGLTNILGGQAATNRQQQVNAELQQEVRAVKEEFIKSLGPNADPYVVNAVNRKEFSGTLGDQNRQMIQFIEAARQELRGADGIDKANKDLIDAQGVLAKVNEALKTSNENLTQAVNALSEKNWTVNVNVPGGSASGDVVSAVNSRS